MDMQSLFAERIGGRDFGVTNEIYKFEKIKRAKAEARTKHPGVELLDFGVGEPDQIAPLPIRETMKRAIDDPANRGYSDNGIREFRVAAADYMAKFFGVTALNPDTEINHSIGSKPALAMLPLCFINPGDVSLVTVPGFGLGNAHPLPRGRGAQDAASEGKRFLPRPVEGAGRDRKARQVDLRQLP